MNKYCVIGSPIEHSLSPIMHNTWFQELGILGHYTKETITPATLKDKIQYLKANYCGFNVTYPLKEKIMPYVDEITPLAQSIGAVNTVKKIGDRWVGYNTDVLGMKVILEENTSDYYFILGSGNMAKTALVALDGKKSTIVCRNIDKGEKIISTAKNTSLTTFEHYQTLPINDKVIISTLPLDVSLEGYLKGKENNTFVDSNYNGKSTYGMKKYISGLDLLILQGVESFYIWTGVHPPIDLAYQGLGYK